MLRDLRAAKWAEVEQRGVAQAIQGADFRVALQIARAAHRVDHVAHERLAEIAFAALGQLADEDVGGNTVFQGQEVLRDHDVQVDLWIGCKERGQFRCQPEVGEGWRAGEGDTLLGVVGVANALGGLGNVGERQLHRVVEDRTGRGQFHRTAGTVEQLGPQVHLQITDLPADGRLGDAQRLGCTGEVLVAGSSDERLDRAQGGHLDQGLIGFGVFDHTIW
ncbi:hypothetical protein D3C80_1439250 [compost metagenome]